MKLFICSLIYLLRTENILYIFISQMIFNLSNDLSIVEIMNDFFSSVFTSEDCDNFPEFEYVTNCKLSNILCNTKEVEKLLKNLNIYKSPGPDSLPPRILKECASVLSSPLCFFFNKSFSTGKLPHLWKLANITPLFKKGSKTDRNNYRRISLTSIMCKIAEKIVKSRLHGGPINAFGASFLLRRLGEITQQQKAN